MRRVPDCDSHSAPWLLVQRSVGRCREREREREKERERKQASEREREKYVDRRRERKERDQFKMIETVCVQERGQREDREWTERV